MTEPQDTFERPAWWVEQVSRVQVDPSAARWWEDRVAEKREARLAARATVLAPAPLPTPPQGEVEWREAPTWTRKGMPGYTYLIAAEGLPYVKIGLARDPEHRLRGLQGGHPLQLHLLWSTPANFENALHKHFAAYRVRGEWFDLTPLGDPVEVVTDAVNELRGAA